MLVYDKTLETCESKLMSLYDKPIFFYSYAIFYKTRNDLQAQFHKVFTDHNLNQQVVSVAGSADFIETALHVAKNIDKVLEQHGYFVILHKWIIMPNIPCKHFLESINEFYHVICVKSEYKQQPTALICIEDTKISGIKTGIFTYTRRKFTNVSPYSNGKLNIKNHFQIWHIN